MLIFIHSLINQPINSKSNELSHSLGRLFSHQSQNLILKYDWITARGYCPFCYNPSKGHEWGIGRGWGGGGGRCLQGNMWYSPPASMTLRLASVTFKMTSKVFIEETDKNFDFITEIPFRFLGFGDFKVSIVIEN